MAYTAKAQVYTAGIQETTIGVGAKAVKLGGEHTQPLCSFDEAWVNAPVVGVEVTDTGVEASGYEEMAAFYAGCSSFAERVAKAAELEGAAFICLHMEGADPNGENKSIEECVALVKEAAAATDKPLVVTGCKNTEKDAQLFSAVAEALP